MRRGSKELAESREERERQRIKADSEAVGRSLNEKNAARPRRAATKEGEQK